MDTEATQTGAEELNSPAPTSVDAAAEQINGLFSTETKKKEAVPAEEPADAETEVVEAESEEEEAAEVEETEQEESEEAQPLTSLAELSQKLGVDESSLYDIKLPIKIDGEEGQATLAQLVKSFQLEGHLNRKSMEVSDLKKEVETQRAAVEQERQAKLAEIGQAARLAQHLLMGEWQQVNWDQLKQNDPIEYLQKKNQFEEYQQALGQMNRLFQDEQAKAQQAQHGQFNEYVADQQKKLLAAVPQWNDEATLKREYPELVSFMQSDFGVTKEELPRLLDHRIYLMALDAKRYRDLKKQNPKVENRDRTPPKVVKAGGAAPKDAVKATELHKQLKKTKSVDSAAALINQLYKKN